MTHIPWRQDSCSSKTRILLGLFGFALWFISFLLFSNGALCQCEESSFCNVSSFQWGNIQLSTQGFSKLARFVILFCFFYSPFIPKGSKGLHLCQQTPQTFRCFLRGIIFQLNAVKPWTLSWLSLMLFFATTRRALLQVEEVALLSWVVFPKRTTSSFTISCWVWERTQIEEFWFFHFPLPSPLTDGTFWLSLSCYLLAGTFFHTDRPSQAWPIRLTRRKQLLWLSYQCDFRKGVYRMYLSFTYLLYIPCI